jgi:hypothetical protein
MSPALSAARAYARFTQVGCESYSPRRFLSTTSDSGRGTGALALIGPHLPACKARTLPGLSYGGGGRIRMTTNQSQIAP